jgi:prephenate dehydrogenase
MSSRFESDVETIAVLGLGVIGGSLVQALAHRAPSLRRVGWSPRSEERTAALESGALTKAPSEWEDAVVDADLVVLAVPLDPCLELLSNLGELTKPAATLTDVASLKGPVRRAAVRSGLTSHWVGSHPMAGSEGSGFAHARAELFEGARVWITDAGAEPLHVERVRMLWALAGGQPEKIQDEAHDRAMALVSHLPQLLANALGAELSRREVPVAALGPGGRDMTRLAASSHAMWMDLFRHAPDELTAGLRGVSATLERAAAALESGRVEQLVELMDESRAWKTES